MPAGCSLGAARVPEGFFQSDCFRTDTETRTKDRLAVLMSKGEKVFGAAEEP